MPKIISVTIADILMVIDAIGGNNFLLLDPIVQPIRDAIDALPSPPTLDTIVPLLVEMDQLEWVHAALSNKAEADYGAVNANLQSALITAAAQDQELAAWLQLRAAATQGRIKAIMHRGCRYFPTLPTDIIPVQTTA